MDRPLAVEVSSASHLLQHAMSRNGTSHIIVCSGQEDLLAALLSQIDLGVDNPSTLLSNTIGTLAAARKVKLTFTPELSHLQAYLSSLTIRKHINNEYGSRTTVPHALILFGMLDLLRRSDSLHAQNLMRVCALAVDAAHAQKCQLVLADVSGSESDGPSDGTTEFATSPWIEEVRMLASTNRLGNDASWAGRMVQVQRIVGRWCRFVSLRDLE